MGKVKLGLLAVVCVALLVPAASAEPWGGFPWCGYGAYWGPYGWWYPYSYQYDRIPYFALYPPVYYSYPLAQPYGLSPFNYGSYGYGGGSPAAQLAGPVTVSNPYAPRMAAKETTPQPQVGGALRIDNPYVAQGNVQGVKASAAGRAEQNATRLVIVSPP